MGNYSTDPEDALQDALKKGYYHVRFQQGKPILDRELNLLGDLASPRRLAPYIGNGVPVGKGGIMADPPSDPKEVDFELEPGRCIVGGLDLVINDFTSYKKQPHQENVQTSWPFKAFGKAGVGWVYLRVFLTEVDDAEDPDLQNQGDIGFETTLRERVDWELLLSDEMINQPDHFLLADYRVNVGVIEEWNDARVTDLTLSQVRRDLNELRSDYETKTASLNPGGSLAVDSVGNAQMKENAVGTAEIMDGAVTTQKLAPLAVTNDRLANNSVGTNNIVNASVVANKIADNAISTPKITDNAVSGPKILTGAVDSTKLAPNSVVSGKIAPASIAVANFKFITTLNAVFSMNAAATQTLTLLPKAFINAENFLIYNVWSDDDLTWSESMVNGARLLKITNTTGATITVNVVARLVLAT